MTAIHNVASLKKRSVPLLERMFFVVVFIGTMHPNLNSIPFLKGVNNQPIAAVFILGFYLSLKRRFWQQPLRKYFIGLFLVIGAYIILALAAKVAPAVEVRPGFYTFPISSFGLVLAVFSYLVGPLLFVYFYQHYSLLTFKLLNWVIGFQLFVVIIQMLSISSLTSALATIFDIVFIEYHSTMLVSLGRGAAGTFPEPSHLGRYSILYIVLALMLKQKSPEKRGPFLFAVTSGGFILISSQSITAIVVVGLFVVAIATKVLLFVRLSHLLRLTALSLSMLMIINFANPSSRFADISEKLQSIPQLAQNLTVLDLQIFGGIRLVSAAIGLKSITLYPFGQGLSSAPNTMFDTAYDLGIPLLETNLYRGIASGKTDSNGVSKPQGLASQYIFDFGIFGIICVVLMVLPIFKISYRTAAASFIDVAPLVGLVLVLFYTTTTFPMPWMLMALITHNTR